jgi:hypothetical protein
VTTVSQQTATQEQPASQTPAAVAMSGNADNEEKKLVISNHWEEQYQQLLHFQKRDTAIQPLSGPCEKNACPRFSGEVDGKAASDL